MTREKLLTRIEKLLALSKSDNPNEAAAAIAKAQELMAEHNMSTRDLKRNQIGSIEVKSSQSVSKAKDWENSLMWSIAKNFGCRLIFNPGYSHNKDYWARWEFLGPKDVLPLAEYLAVYLLRTLVKARNDYSRQLTQQGYRGKEKTAMLDGFAKGWVAIIRKRVTAFQIDDETAKLMDEMVQEVTQGNKTNQHSRGSDFYARLEGERAASGIDINRPMNAEEQKRLS